jgi:hypothetical protein
LKLGYEVQELCKQEKIIFLFTLLIRSGDFLTSVAGARQIRSTDEQLKRPMADTAEGAARHPAKKALFNNINRYKLAPKLFDAVSPDQVFHWARACPSFVDRCII